MLKQVSKKLKALLLLGMAVILTGCANIEYSRVVYPTGEILDSITVTLDTQQITAANYNLTALTEIIRDDLSLYFLTNISTFKSESWICDDLTQEEKNDIQNNITYDANITNDKTQVIAYIYFKNRTAYTAYQTWLNPNYETELQEANTPTIVTGTFFNTQIITNNSVYAQYLQSSIANTINTKYFNTLGLGETFNLSDDITIMQSYGNADTSIDSNATSILLEGGIKMHVWEIDPTTTSQVLEFYYHTPNTPNWYLSALSIAVISVLIIYVNKILKGKYQNTDKIIFRTNQK